MENEREVVSKNVRLLMEHAKKQGVAAGPASQKALARQIEENAEKAEAAKLKAIRVNRRTIERVLKGEVAPGVDTLGAIAAAYGLPAWQLLLTDFDPAHPACVLTLAERQRIADWKAVYDLDRAAARGDDTRPGRRKGAPAARARPGAKPKARRQVRPREV